MSAVRLEWRPIAGAFACGILLADGVLEGWVESSPGIDGRNTFDGVPRVGTARRFVNEDDARHYVERFVGELVGLPAASVPA